MYTYRFASFKSVHLTICMLDLYEPAKLETAKAIADDLKQNLIEAGVLTDEGLKINFEGVDTFPDLGPEVLNPKMFFLKIREDSQFEKLKKVSNIAIRRCIENKIINLGDKGNYRFHLSIVDDQFNVDNGKSLYPVDKKKFDPYGSPESQLTVLQ